MCHELLNIADNYGENSEQRAHYCALARSELLSIEPELSNSRGQYNSGFARILFEEGKYEEAAARAQLAIDEAPPQEDDPVFYEERTRSMLVDAYSIIMESYRALLRYPDVLRSVASMHKLTIGDLDRFSRAVESYQLRAIEALFHMGHYNEVMRWALDLLKANRHVNVYAYVARSFKAVGKLDEAIATMQKAVHYDTPWDKKTVQQSKDLLEELLREREGLREA